MVRIKRSRPASPGGRTLAHDSGAVPITVIRWSRIRGTLAGGLFRGGLIIGLLIGDQTQNHRGLQLIVHIADRQQRLENQLGARGLRQAWSELLGGVPELESDLLEQILVSCHAMSSIEVDATFIFYKMIGDGKVDLGSCDIVLSCSWINYHYCVNRMSW